jgi:hypothetical protein
MFFIVSLLIFFILRHNLFFKNDLTNKDSYNIL